MLNIGYLMQNGAVDLSTLSGPQLHVKAVIQGLNKRGHNVRVVATQNKRLMWSDDYQTWLPVKFKYTMSRWFRLVERPVRRLQSELDLPYFCWFDSLHYADAFVQSLHGYDILYERHGYLGYGGVIASRWLGIPLVIEINGNIVKEIDEIGVSMSDVQRKLGRVITYQTWKAASHIVVVSETLKQQLVFQLRIPDDKVTVVMNGVDIDTFTGAGFSELALDIIVSNGRPIIAFVGSFQPWHGVKLLIDAFSMITKKYPGIRLVLIGEGGNKDEVVECVEKLGLIESVIFTGKLSQKDVAAVLKLADILVAPYPYLHDDIVGTPLKILEYMASGKAILASTASIHEAIVDGKTGIRVAPADAAELANGLERLLDDPALCDVLGSNARQEACEKYSWDRSVDKLEAIFQSLMINDRKTDFLAKKANNGVH